MILRNKIIISLPIYACRLLFRKIVSIALGLRRVRRSKITCPAVVKLLSEAWMQYASLTVRVNSFSSWQRRTQVSHFCRQIILTPVLRHFVRRDPRYVAANEASVPDKTSKSCFFIGSLIRKPCLCAIFIHLEHIVADIRGYIRRYSHPRSAILMVCDAKV